MVAVWDEANKVKKCTEKVHMTGPDTRLFFASVSQKRSTESLFITSQHRRQNVSFDIFRNIYLT
jgi:hypothetical protein